jgi:hypothetical protein
MTATMLTPDTVVDRIHRAHALTPAVATAPYPRRAKYSLTGTYKTAAFALPRRATWSHDQERDRDFLTRMHALTGASR